MGRFTQNGRQQATRDSLARRLREVRRERFGDDVEALADELGIPSRTWLNYESRVSMPAETLLDFVAITRARPVWLRTGEGEKYADP